MTIDTEMVGKVITISDPVRPQEYRVHAPINHFPLLVHPGNAEPVRFPMRIYVYTWVKGNQYVYNRTEEE